MTTIEQLNRDLDDGIWITLRAIADAYEEQGDERMAEAYRHIVERRYVPRRDNNRGPYGWHLSGDHPWTDGRPHVSEHFVQKSRFGEVTGNVPAPGQYVRPPLSLWCYFATRAEAYAALAKAYKLVKKPVRKRKRVKA